MSDSYDALKLENQLCFPLYACSREITKAYKPFLDKLGLTYTQYIVMMVLWEHQQCSVKAMGEYLYLDSGTLTPLLKKLEARGLLTRHRDPRDERVVQIVLTPQGQALRDRAVDVPQQMGACLCMSPEEAQTLYRLLHKLLAQFE